MTEERFGVYVHYPLCWRRCGYCDFAIVPLDRWRGPFPQAAYTAAVQRELESRRDDFAHLTLASIYVGGGTPSLWQSEALASVLQTIRALFRAAQNLEVTVEVNPEDLTTAQLRALRTAGVNRLSIGAQAMDDDLLRRLGRQHTVAQIRTLFDAARATGFPQISADLIFGIDGQRLGHHITQLRALADLAPEHISTYALTLSRGAALRAAGVLPAADDLVADMMRQGRDTLESLGYAQVEVSNYARPGCASRHNSDVWAGLPYLGLGAAAHSLIPVGAGIRSANPPFSRYLLSQGEGRSPTLLSGARATVLSSTAAAADVVMLGLRTTAGICRAAYRRRFARDVLEDFGSRLSLWAARGLIGVTPDRVAPTREGIWFADGLASDVLAGTNEAS